MRLFEKELSDDELLDSIRKNVCNRNQDLAALVRILSHLPNSNVIMGLDGDWGSGKTCLIRELELVWQNKDNPLSGMVTQEEVEAFRTHYIPFYYNAWENDYAEDPAQSLLMALAEYLEEEQTLLAKSGRRLLESVDISECIKEKTGGLINLKGMGTNPDTMRYASEVNRGRKLRKAISDLIENKLKITDGCRFLFIIDDLDRCRPTYAVKLIETIKNIFSFDKIACLVATNFVELGNVIRGYYGGYIDGHQYLDRIFDCKMSLNNIDVNKYIMHKLPTADTWAVKNVASGLKMNMRELNRYLGIIYLYDSYFSGGWHVARDQTFHNICRYIFIPIIVGYKIKNLKIYHEITSGKGYNYIQTYLKNNKEMRNYVDEILQLVSRESGQMNDDLNPYYAKLFSEDRNDITDAKNSFWDILNLTSSNLDLD